MYNFVQHTMFHVMQHILYDTGCFVHRCLVRNVWKLLDFNELIMMMQLATNQIPQVFIAALSVEWKNEIFANNLASNFQLSFLKYFQLSSLSCYLLFSDYSHFTWSNRGNIRMITIKWYLLRNAQRLCNTWILLFYDSNSRWFFPMILDLQLRCQSKICLT